MELQENLRGKRVVVVEDEGITQMHLHRTLKRAGLCVVGAAASGPDGVDIALRENPDIILMDINMPGPYNGLEAARRILSQRTACIIILTAYNDYRATAEEIGASGYVVKPLDDTALLPALFQAWNRYQKTGAGDPVSQTH